MADDLSGRRIAFLMANEGVEEVELTGPRDAVQSAGAKVVLVAPSKGTIQAFNHLDKGSTFQADVAVADARAEDYDGLVLPGGVKSRPAAPGRGRCCASVQELFAMGKPVAVICHAAWTRAAVG